MMRAGIGSIRALADACAKITPPRIGVKKRDASSVGKNLVGTLLTGRARVISFEQLAILCKALNCTPNHLLGFEPVPGFEAGTTERKVERVEQKVDRLTELLERVATQDTPFGREVHDILKKY